MAGESTWLAFWLICLPCLSSTLNPPRNYSGQALIKVPSGIPSTVKSLDLSLNYLKSLHMLNFSNVILLNVSFNRLECIDPDAFDNLRLLKVLDLSHNNLTGNSLGYKLFKNLEHLRRLVLRNNPLTELKDFSLTFHPSLLSLELDLSHCKISQIGKNAIDSFLTLRELNLASNEISDISPITDWGMSLVDYLDLSDNRLTKIQTRMFQKLDHLRTLNLSRNRISRLSFKSFSGLDSLEVLSLADNLLTDFHPDVFLGVELLRRLDLSKNPLRVLSAAIFPDDLKRTLHVIRLENMTNLRMIESGGSKSFTDLREVYISNDPRLSYIDPTAFQQSFHSLQVVHLENVALRSISLGMLPWSQLSDLRLQSNSWRCDCHLRWALVSDSGLKRPGVSFRCDAPASLRGRDLYELSPDQLRCLNLTWVYIGIGVGSAILLVFITAMIVVRKRRRSAGRLSNREYVSVYSNEAEDTIMVIQNPGEMTALTDAVNV